MGKNEHVQIQCPLPRAAHAQILLAHGGGGRLMHELIRDTFMRAFENAYIQSTQSAMDPRHWAGMKRMVSDYTQVPGFREYWPNRKHWYSEDFQDFMDTEILQSGAGADVPLPGNY